MDEVDAIRSSAVQAVPIRLIGYWWSSYYGGLDPHPADLCDPAWNSHDRGALLRYLENAPVLFAYFGYAHCRFNCGIDDKQMGCRTLTDGTWGWPQGLGHYIREYAVRLPDEFAAHAKQAGFEIQYDLPNDPWLPAPEVDRSFWRAWAFENFPRAELDRLIGEHQKALSHREAAEARILSEKYGCGQSKCVWEGCNEMALLGLGNCPKCSVRLGYHEH